jgi:predicted DNA-binding protein (MmcQ/YjbR family)
MTRAEFLAYCKETYGTEADHPFEGDFETVIARHTDSGKWFAAILRHENRDIVNLKCEPLEGEFLRSVFQGITPGYHMNKTHWISVDFQSDVPDDLLCELTRNSFRLTDRKRKLV